MSAKLEAYLSAKKRIATCRNTRRHRKCGHHGVVVRHRTCVAGLKPEQMTRSPLHKYY